MATPPSGIPMQPPQQPQYHANYNNPNHTQMIGGVPQQHPPSSQQQIPSHHTQQYQHQQQPPTLTSIPTKQTTLNPPPRGSGITTSTPDEELEDGRVRNLEAVTKIRDAWIYTQISARAEEFTQYRNVSLY